MNTIGLFGVLSGSAVALSFFLSSFFLLLKRKENIKHVWLGLILLAVGLRVGKSIIYFLANGIAPIGLSLGFIGLASIGPLLWFFLTDLEKIRLRNSWHFILPVSGAITCFIVTPSPWETMIYISGTLVLLLYVVLGIAYQIRYKKYVDWNRKVLIMTSGVLIALVYQHISNTMMDYAFGSIIASFFLYWIFYQSFKTSVFTKRNVASLPYQTLKQVKTAFEIDKLFKEQGMTLQFFSTRLNIPPYLVTRCIRKLYDQTFPEVLNNFRIEELKQMLLDPNKEHLKIESLAYDVGFSSPSTFYASFKKVTGQTPTEYQKEAARMSA